MIGWGAIGWVLHLIRSQEAGWFKSGRLIATVAMELSGFQGWPCTGLRICGLGTRLYTCDLGSGLHLPRVTPGTSLWLKPLKGN